MFSLLGLSALLVFLLLRPQEFVPLLQKLPLLYLFFAAAVGGLLVDLKLRLLKPVPARSLLAAVPFYAWCVVVIGIKVPAAEKISSIIELTIVFVTYVVLAQGVQSFRSLRFMAGALIVCAMFLTVVGIHQANAPTGCLMLENYIQRLGVPDGRPCDTAQDCAGVEAEPGAAYDCQRIGLFGTTALNDRVRYRGELQDPNELSTFISGCVALLIALAAGARGPGAGLLAGLGGLLVLLCVIYTQSRGGMLAFLAVLGVYFVRRYGIKYILLGAVALLPLMTLGGRGGEAAEASTEGRYEAWYAGLQMLKSDPVFGVGYGQFTEYHHLTAHNSHVLAAAELGLLGVVLWFALLYIAFKPPLMVLRDFAGDPRARTARSWAMAVLGMGAAHLVQMMFLSLTYHTMTWLFFGFAGAFYSAVKAHAPDWEVRVGLLDVVLVVGMAIGFVMAVFALLIVKGY